MGLSKDEVKEFFCDCDFCVMVFWVVVFCVLVGFESLFLYMEVFEFFGEFDWD